MKQICIILATMIMISGCSSGVSQAEYDAVVSERDALQSEIDDLASQKESNAPSFDVKLESEGEGSAETSQTGTLSLGDTFEFDNLEITFSGPISWHVFDAPMDENNGADVFCVPIKIKNINSETHGLNMFYYNQYGSRGTELDSVSTYFDDDVISSGDMRAGAELESLMYFLYDGNGDYYVEFEILGDDAIEVKIPIVK